MEKELLSTGQIPSQASVIVESGTPELAASRATVSGLSTPELAALMEDANRLKQAAQALEDAIQSRNEDLYGPMFASRELIIVSLLMHQRDLLDELVEREIQVKTSEIEKDESLGNRRERKEIRKAFLKEFKSNKKLSYFRLARAWEFNKNNQMLLEVLTRAEQAFLDDYENQGCKCGEAIDVRLSMRALRFTKKRLHQSVSHLFEFDFMEDIEQQRKMQAVVLLDVQNAIKKNWLYGDFKIFGNPHSGTLGLEIVRRTKELEYLSGCSIADLAEMPMSKEKAL